VAGGSSKGRRPRKAMAMSTDTSPKPTHNPTLEPTPGWPGYVRVTLGEGEKWLEMVMSEAQLRDLAARLGFAEDYIFGSSHIQWANWQ